MNDERCDAGLPDGTRCRNRPSEWIHMSFQPNVEIIEDWPVLVCDPCKGKALSSGQFHRMGPDRRAQYAEWKRAES